tara:strand:+ start:3551 stop:4558 length:1008 start_codon:yes stop_codon:yes gene_type:complete
LKKITQHPIDIVVAWVDGADPEIRQKKISFLKSNGSFFHPGASQTRFHSLNEVEYCVLSILKFAPFIRNIFIVTDQQDPKIDRAIKKYFPERFRDIRIVDHNEIFEGYEDYIPTFNSICISNMLWRIKGLSDQFVYFNDDIFLLRPVNPSDWFVNNKPVLRGRWSFPPYERLLWDKLKEKFMRFFTSKKYQERSASFQVNQWNAAKKLGFRWRYFRSGHTPVALNRQTLKNYFDNHPEMLKKNISFRFRNYYQFNTVALANHLEIKSGNKNRMISQVIYLRPHKRGEDYVNRKLSIAGNNKNFLFICVQSLDLVNVKDQEKVIQKMKILLELDIK